MPQIAYVGVVVRQLTDTDHNFKGRAIPVQRGPATFVTDTDDVLRGALMRVMVGSLLKDLIPASGRVKA